MLSASQAPASDRASLSATIFSLLKQAFEGSRVEGSGLLVLGFQGLGLLV